jgi:O-antigen/teichoic acid export membrane protein
VRRSDLRPVSKTKIIQSIGNIVLSIGLGVLAFGASGLLFATLIASWLGISILVRHAPDLLQQIRRLRRVEVIVLVRRFLQQAVLSTSVSGLNVVSSQAMILLLALVYAPGQVGLVAFAQRLFAAPVGIVAQALSQSFWAHAADLVQASDYQGLRRDYLKVTALLIGLAVGLLIFAVIVQPLIVLIFGPKWVALGGVLLALMPMILGAAIVSPTNHLVVLNRQGLQLYADILRLGLVCSAITCAAVFDWGFVWAVLAVACSSFLGHIVLFFLQLHLQSGLIERQLISEEPVQK